MTVFCTFHTDHDISLKIHAAADVLQYRQE